MRIIKLSTEQFELLLLALGISIGASYSAERRDLARRLVDLADTVNKRNPDWAAFNLPPWPEKMPNAEDHEI